MRNNSNQNPSPVDPTGDDQFPVIGTRRQFLAQCASALAGITIIGVAAPLLQGCEPTTGPGNFPGTTGNGPGNGSGNGNGNGGTIFDVSSLTADGESLVTSTRGPDGKHILLVRVSAAEYLALSMECTHQQCEVAPPSGGVMVCPCHASRFNLQGEVLTGPASSALRRYAATYDPTTRAVTVDFQA
jgi:Rieske Fe-S protein